MIKLTPTEQAIYDTLSDGRLHKRDDLLGCLADPSADRKCLQRHMYKLRKKLINGVILDAVAKDNTIFYRLAFRFKVYDD